MALEIFAVVVFFICQYKNVDRVCMGEYNHLEWISCFVDGTDFGQCFRSTGALNMLLNTLDQVLPSKTGKAVTLCSVVGGYLGAFNGFATYPVTIPGLVRQGIDGFRAAVGYLVYFS